MIPELGVLETALDGDLQTARGERAGFHNRPW